MTQGFAKKQYSAPAWQDWSPTYSNITVGSGTVVARYIHLGTQVIARWSLTLASDSSIGTAPTISAPVTPDTTISNGVMGTVILRDSGGSTYPGDVTLSGNNLALVVWNAAGTYTIRANITSTVPFTWITGDSIQVIAVYESAEPAVYQLETAHFHHADGYTGGQELFFTSSDSFAKADYPGLRAIRVKMVGGGGGGAGAGSTSGASGSGGGSGAYSESLLLVTALGTSETVTVGAGGAGGATGANNGSDGTNSSFGSLVVAEGGDGGTTRPSGNQRVKGGAPGLPANGTGDFLLEGERGGTAYEDTALRVGGNGGGSHLGTPTEANELTNGGSAPGSDGRRYGGGGQGGCNDGGGAQSGGDGHDGIVIVELLY